MKYTYLLVLLTILISCAEDVYDPYVSSNEILMKSKKVQKQKAFKMSSDQKDSTLVQVQVFNDDGKLIEETTYQKDGIAVDSQKEYTFDGNKREVQSVFTYYPNTYRRKKSVVLRTIEYDDKGFRKSASIKTGNDIKNIKIDCNRKGKVTSRTTYNTDGEKINNEIYKYNKKGNLKELIIKNDDKNTTKYTYKYDKKGLNTKILTLENDKLISETAYDYSPDGKRVMETGTTEKGFTELLIAFNYNKQGLISESITDYPLLKNEEKTEVIRYYYIFFN